MLKNSTYGQSGGSHCFQGAYPVGRRESVKHWFFKGRQRPPANPPDTSQSRSDCPLCRPPEGFTTHSKKSNVPGVRSCASRGRCKMWFQRPGALCGASVGHGADSEIARREKPQADSFSAAAGVFLPDPVDSISAKRSSSSRMRRSISAICCTMVRFFSLSRETMQVR